MRQILKLECNFNVSVTFGEITCKILKDGGGRGSSTRPPVIRVEESLFDAIVIPQIMFSSPAIFLIVHQFKNKTTTQTSLIKMSCVFIKLLFSTCRLFVYAVIRTAARLLIMPLLIGV